MERGQPRYTQSGSSAASDVNKGQGRVNAEERGQYHLSHGCRALSVGAVGGVVMAGVGILLAGFSLGRSAAGL